MQSTQLHLNVNLLARRRLQRLLLLHGHHITTIIPSVLFLSNSFVGQPIQTVWSILYGQEVLLAGWLLLFLLFEKSA